ncbi:MAG: response regulator transcription factor [Bacteroidetes bacterium]|nr:response regulator transcription factor [Bacteroidota bacterium]MCW5894149.1 response regulator transcription factor [Bacteroidota bacterium]
MRILLVDDSAMFRNLVRKFLSRNLLGENEILECSNGHEAFHSYRTFSPDWVLMDIMMGGSDGLVAARQIREIDPHARIVMLTQFNERAYREEAKAIGARGYVLKEYLGSILPLLSSQSEARQE